MIGMTEILALVWGGLGLLLGMTWGRQYGYLVGFGGAVRGAILGAIVGAAFHESLEWLERRVQHLRENSPIRWALCIAV